MGERIESWAQLRRAAPQILSQLNADDRLALAAAANPLLAIERLDYVISPAVATASLTDCGSGPRRRRGWLRLKSRFPSTRDMRSTRAIPTGASPDRGPRRRCRGRRRGCRG